MAITQAKTIRKKKGSIKRMEEAVIRQDSIVDQNLTPLKGNLSFHYCEECGDNKVHRIQEGFRECISCKTKENLLIGELQEEKVLNDIIIF